MDKKVELFLGGPEHLFEIAGEKTFDLLNSLGICETSKVLDIGCGFLRIGATLIKFLNKKSYFGIEPAERMTEEGMDTLLSKEDLIKKQPTFDFNKNYDLSCFNRKFDFFILRSVWTHCAKKDILSILDQFVELSNPGGKLLASIIKDENNPTLVKKGDYMGETWEDAVIYHSIEWIEKECLKRNLKYGFSVDHNFGQQEWFIVSKQ